MGGDQNEVEAVEAGQREAYDESLGTKENCGCAAEKMGSGESEEGRLNDNAATKVIAGRKLGRSSAEFSAMETYHV